MSFVFHILGPYSRVVGKSVINYRGKCYSWLTICCRWLFTSFVLLCAPDPLPRLSFCPNDFSERWGIPLLSTFSSWTIRLSAGIETERIYLQSAQCTGLLFQVISKIFALVVLLRALWPRLYRLDINPVPSVRIENTHSRFLGSKSC